jgi:drug/metabolite transporter, DME family
VDSTFAVKMRRLERYSVLFIALAAVLWATDVYFRAGLLQHLSANEIVLMEDLIEAAVLLPLLVINRDELRRLTLRGWIAVAAVGIGPQAIATVLFTQSLLYGDFAVTYVLQQTQPLIAVLLAGLILGERRRGTFWPGVYLVAFAPDPGAPFTGLPHARLMAALLALGAAALWALGTVLGRYLLNHISFPTMTSLRFTAAIPVLVILVLVTEGVQGFQHYRAGDATGFIGLALVTGVIALLIYYRFLAVTPASLSIIAEMAYPVASTLIASLPHPVGFGQPMFPGQIAGTALLMLAILFANWGRMHGVVERPRAGTAPEPTG